MFIVVIILAFSGKGRHLCVYLAVNTVYPAYETSWACLQLYIIHVVHIVTEYTT